MQHAFEVVARRRFAETLGEVDELTVYGRRGQGRLLQGEALDPLPEVVGEMPPAPIPPALAGKSGETLTPHGKTDEWPANAFMRA